MDSIAELGLRIDSSDADVAAARLDRLTPAAARTQQAVDSLNRTAMAGTPIVRTNAGAVEGLATAHGHASIQSMEAFRATHNLVLAFAGGVSPTYALTRAISELSYASAGRGGLAGAFGGISEMFKGLIAGEVAVVGAIVAVAGAVAYVTRQSVLDQKATQDVLLGTGRAAGLTESQLNAVAAASARQANIGIGAARSYALAYAASGAVVGKSIGDLTTLTDDYAATTRQKTDDAVKQLTGDFGNLKTGIDDLNQHLGFLDAATRQHVLDLVAQGRESDAVRATLDAMGPSLARHRESLTLVGRAWADVESGASAAYQAIKQAISPDTQHQLDAAIVRLRMLQSTQGQGYFIDPGQMQRAKDEVTRLIAEIGVEGARAAKNAHDQIVNALSIKANDAAMAIQPAIGQISAALNNVGLLKQQLGLGEGVILEEKTQAPGQTASQTEMTSRALAAQRGYVNSLSSAYGELNVQGRTFLSQEQVQDEQSRIAIRSLYDRTAAQARETAEAVKREQLRGVAMSDEERERQITLAGAQAYDAVAKSLDDQNRAIDLGTRSILDQANAWLRGDVPAMIQAQAHYQAMTEAISQGIDVGERERQLVLQMTAERASSAAQAYDETRTQVDAQGAANRAVLSGAIAYGDASRFVETYVRNQMLSNLMAAAEETHNARIVAQVQQLIDGYAKLSKQKSDDAKLSQAIALLHPYDADLGALEKLNEQLREGAIDKQQFDAAMSKTGLSQDFNQLREDLFTANPFGVGGQLGMQSAVDQAMQEQARRLQQVQDDLQAGLIKSEADAATFRVAIEQDAANKIIDAWTRTLTAQLNIAATGTGQLADALGGLVGKSSAAYKTMFYISKAFTLASAIVSFQGALMKALDSGPFPENLGAWAAVAGYGATIIATIVSTAAPSVPSHARGVVDLQGPGTGTSDSIFSRLSRGESVVTAAATDGNRETLAAMNRGRSFDAMFGGAAGGVTVNIVHDGSTAVEYERVSDSHIMVIARRVVRDEAPNVVAASQLDANGVVAKSTRNSINAGRARQ